MLATATGNCDVTNVTYMQSRIKGQGGPGQFLLEGPYDVIRDVIVYKRYVFAYLQGSRLLFPIVENVLTQLYLQVAASREFDINTTVYSD